MVMEVMNSRQHQPSSSLQSHSLHIRSVMTTTFPRICIGVLWFCVCTVLVRTMTISRFACNCSHLHVCVCWELQHRLCFYFALYFLCKSKFLLESRIGLTVIVIRPTHLHCDVAKEITTLRRVTRLCMPAHHSVGQRA